ncbi:YciI family protein [Ornithinimicrobium avium]|uniref:Transcription initiation protein n=1 Tax=Ornithinimicrobium avium TaxID=2283195 RepID=A0A345NNW5_9MICO|nr:YciI family protein [Ornithinimicrobium avium]AXH96723.1 transcription initiation protein [Ornithinimicrobium avium]
MTEYMVVIVGDADRWWSTMSMQERKDGYAEYTRFSEELTRRGHRITGGAELHATTEARTVRPGGRSVTDGPFAESAEHVGGFYMVETEDPDDLAECCKIIAALGDGVEIRRTVRPEERSAPTQGQAP